VDAWLSYTIAGNRTRAGQPLDEAFALAASCDAVIAVGVNCCAPQDVEPAVKVAAETTGKPVVVYPTAARSGRRDPRVAGAEHVRRAAGAVLGRGGARLVGGCCRSARRESRESRRSPRSN